MAVKHWLWYPGDFELYHALQQNFSRVERGIHWPAFWKSEGFRNRIVIWKEYDLKEETEFCVHARGIGFIRLNGQKKHFEEQIQCGPGKVTVVIHIGRIEALPSVYVEGDIICSDEGWMAEDYDRPAQPAGCNEMYTSPDQDPAVVYYSERVYKPVKVEVINGGFLYELETELTAALEIKADAGRLSDMQVYCGESREEALDTIHCYYSWKPDVESGRCPRCAVRFVFIPGNQVDLVAVHQFIDIPVKATFVCDDPLLNQIWDVAEHTFTLCSGMFFIDGIKRDKWIWSGDAYQSLFVNRYLMADPGIDQRTLLALRGNDVMTTHINTIVDYSLYWILGVKAHYDAYHDLEFVKQVYPKMKSLMEFCQTRLDSHGFIEGKDQDWTFIDWADLDKEGPLGAEQMLLAGCWKVMSNVCVLVEDTAKLKEYEEKGRDLVSNINTFYWDSEKGAYIDSFVSGKCHVTRQTNLFALLFGVAGKDQTDQIMENVIKNASVAPITTPYFNFFALDAMGRMGDLTAILDTIRDYWGGMLERGAVTFWEEFDPKVPLSQQYDMYGDKFGKSLCHAWSASPIYLIARYFVGLNLIGSDEVDFVLTPHLEFFHHLDCRLPVGSKGNFVHILWDGERLKVMTDCRKGYLEIDSNRYLLLKDEPFCQKK